MFTEKKPKLTFYWSQCNRKDSFQDILLSQGLYSEYFAIGRILSRTFFITRTLCRIFLIGRILLRIFSYRKDFIQHILSSQGLSRIFSTQKVTHQNIFSPKGAYPGYFLIGRTLFRIIFFQKDLCQGNFS